MTAVDETGNAISSCLSTCSERSPVSPAGRERWWLGLVSTVCTRGADLSDEIAQCIIITIEALDDAATAPPNLLFADREGAMGSDYCPANVLPLALWQGGLYEIPSGYPVQA
jgi:hypothetical protein